MTTSRLTRSAIISLLAAGAAGVSRADEPVAAQAAGELSSATAAAQADAPLTGGSVSATLGDVPAGKSLTIVYRVSVDAGPFPAGKANILNQGAVSGTNFANVLTDDPDVVGTANPTATPLDAAPDLSITKDDGGISTTPGGTVVYNMTISNTGTQGTTGVDVTDVVPANATFNAGASLPGWVCVPDANPGSTCTFDIGNFAAGQVNALNIAFTVVNPLAAGVTQISNTVSIGDGGVNGPDPTPANNSATDTTPVTAAPDLAITKSDGGVSVAPGGSVTYTLNYSNGGNQGATGVTLTETVPANTTFTGVGWTCTPDNNAGSTCTFLVAGELAGGGGAGSTGFQVTVASPVAAGVDQISNTASISDDAANGADPTPANNSSTDTTPVDAEPDLALTKDDGGISVNSGGVIPYTLSYSNVGNQGATGVILTDTVPANTTFNATASLPTVWSCPDGSPATTVCNVLVGAVAAAGNGSATFAVTVLNQLPAGVTQISNTAGVTDDGANGIDPNGANNTASDTTPVTAVPDIQVTKDDGRIVALPNQVLSYQIQVSNVGGQDATGVVLTDTVPNNTQFLPASSTAGWTCVPDNNAGAGCGFNVGAVAAGASAQVVVFAVKVIPPVTPGTSLVNTVNATDDGANGADPNTSNNTASDNNTLVTTKGDLNANGTADLVFQHAVSGNVVAWFMNGPIKTGGTMISPNGYGTWNWRVRAIDDFNLDGKADLVFRNVNTGDVRIWTMNGTTRLTEVTPNPGGVATLNWNVVGTGDFNLDGESDLLWQNDSSGKTVVWEMANFVRQLGQFTNPDQAGNLNWKAAGTGDFDGDGSSDILWRNATSGAMVVWYMNGVNRTSGSLMATSESDLTWKIVAVADYDGDNDPDILWWNGVTGKLRLWTMAGAAFVSNTATTPDQVNAVPFDLNWQIAGPR